MNSKQKILETIIWVISLLMMAVGLFQNDVAVIVVNGFLYLGAVIRLYKI